MVVCVYVSAVAMHFDCETHFRMARIAVSLSEWDRGRNTGISMCSCVSLSVAVCVSMCVSVSLSFTVRLWCIPLSVCTHQLFSVHLHSDLCTVSPFIVGQVTAEDVRRFLGDSGHDADSTFDASTVQLWIQRVPAKARAYMRPRCQVCDRALRVFICC